jgi:hypothetical protein
MIQVINLIGTKSLELILARDIAGNSPLMKSVLQKRNSISQHFWDIIIKAAGCFYFYYLLGTLLWKEN